MGNEPAQNGTNKPTIPTITQPRKGTVSVQLAHDDEVRDLLRLKTREAAHGIFATALNALGAGGAEFLDLAAAMAVEMEPRDALEAMLLAQMTATHVAMTTLSQKVADAPSVQLREASERSMTRLSRTFLAQMDALKRYRAKAQQVVRVERVEVREGGQAIVGDVTHGRVSD